MVCEVYVDPGKVELKHSPVGPVLLELSNVFFFRFLNLFFFWRQNGVNRVVQPLVGVFKTVSWPNRALPRLPTISAVRPIVYSSEPT